ncbi:MAG: DUF6538 domain-containing protein [Alphaproteobacteria bacterium]
MEDDLANVPKMQQRKHGIWYFRMRVPAHLQESYGKKEVVKSLGTSNKKEAQKRFSVLDTQVTSELEEIEVKLKAQKDEPDMLSNFNNSELERIAVRWFHEQKDQDIDISDLSEDERRDIFINLEIDENLYRDEVKGITETEEHKGMTAAYHYLKHRNITFNPKSEAFKTLGHYMSRALAESARKSVRRWKNQPFNVSDAMFLDAQHYGGGNHSILPNKTIGALCDEYINDPTKEHSPGTEYSYAVLFRALRELLGAETFVKTITHQDCKDIQILLMKTPSNAKKLAPNKTLKQAAELAEKKEWKTLSRKTVNNYLGMLSALMKYAVEAKYIHENPAKGLKMKSKKKSKDRYPFDTEQLAAIFTAPLYTGCKNDGNGYSQKGSQIIKKTRFWIPLISLFTGMRLNEICQLEIEDFTKAEGVHIINVREENDEGEKTKQVKTLGSVRTIPIHPELEGIGLLDYVDDMRSKGHVRLWPDLTQNSRGYYSDAFSKWFARFLKNSNTKKPKTSFHSFRHNFRTEMANKAFPHDMIVKLGGWSANSVEGGYVGKLSIPAQYEYICKISYEGLDLSHLHVKDAKDGENPEDLPQEEAQGQ